MNWSITDSEANEGDPAVTLELKDDSYSRSMWDFSFQALYKVALHSTSLSTTLKITNTDDKPFSFNSALHSYFSVSSSFMKETKSYLFIKHIIINSQVFGCTGFNFWCFSERSQRL
jgi:D-hexose-6-phosphate mutarotase